MFSNLFKRDRAAPAYRAAPALVSPGTRVYAVGDIHGCVGPLRALHEMILDDSASAPSERKVIIYIGDYIDRGLQSRQVVELLINDPLPGFKSVYLRGNHEDFMLRFLDDPSVGQLWFANGGNATLDSYGVGMSKANNFEERMETMRDELAVNLPERHFAFFLALKHTHVEGDYFFAHAGIRPGVALDSQEPEDLMWVRNEFLKSGADHGKIVVHGHSITDELDIRHNRIGIDTGAFMNGRLTCLVLEGGDRSFLHT